MSRPSIAVARLAAFLACSCLVGLCGQGVARAAALAGAPELAADKWASEPASPITDHFAIRAGYFWGTAATSGVITDPTAATPGTPFSLENDFHLSPRARQLRVEFLFRMRERSRLRVDTWELNRNGLASPLSNITYGGNTFTSADQVHSVFDWRQVDFTYTYSFVRRSRFELGAGLGLHLLQAEASADVSPSITRPTAVHEDFSGAGPFATVALDGNWRLTRRLALAARGQYLNLHIRSVAGSLGDYHADLQFRWRANVAIGLGYQSTLARLEVSQHNPDGTLHLGLHGPELFLRASF